MKKLSPLELEVFQHICDKGEVTVRQVHERISGQRDAAYSTIKTIFDRLESKGAIERTSKIGKASVYAAVVDGDDVRKNQFLDFVQQVFPGDRMPLLNTLVRDTDLSEEEIKYLTRLLEERRSR